MKIRLTNKILFPIIAFLWSTAVFAQVISPKGVERKFRYSASLFIQSTAPLDVQTEINNHVDHLFGVLKSPTLVQRYGGPEGLEAFAVPRIPVKTSKIRVSKEGDGQRIRYEASGVFLLHQDVQEHLKSKELNHFELHMPDHVQDIYDPKCTDDHYNTAGDYPFFFDPYKKGCEYLLTAPFTRLVKVELGEAPAKPTEQNFQRNALRADNGNGAFFKIAIAVGFDEGPGDPNDAGRLNYEALAQDILGRGFELKADIVRKSHREKFFTKLVSIGKSKVIPVEIKILKAETNIDSRNNRFAKFLAESLDDPKSDLNTADVFIYAGHSGLGGNLDLDSLSQKVRRPIQADPNKRQLLVIDGCMSYSYFLESYRALKPKSKIDIITNGLSSYFETGPATMSVILDYLLSDSTKNPSWMEFLKALEEPLDGYTYLVNVGAV